MRAKTTLVTLLLLVASSAQAAGLKLPAVKDVVLDNGLRVQLVRHATVPMVSMELWLDAGARFDPDGKEGLASLTVEALRRGAGDLDAEAFAEALAYLGANFSTSVDPDRARVALDLQSKDLQTGLGLLADAVLRPRFEDEEVSRLASRMSESVLQAKENPRNVLGDYHRAHLYGGHPYGRPVDGTETSLTQLGVDDVKRFHGDHFGAGAAILTLVGDLDPGQAERLIRDAFGSMPAGRRSAARLPAPTAPKRTDVLLVDKTDTPQTWFMIGTLGPSWKDLDDYAATELVQTVFGGRFTSWLNSALRIEAGLTYGASYRIQRGMVAGPASISTFTAKETTKEAIDLALATLDRLHEEGLDADELKSAKAYVKGQLPYDYETPSDLATAYGQMAFYGIDRDWLVGLFDRIDAVTLEECEAAIDRWFSRENLCFTAIGVAAEVKDVLASYGPVTVRDNGAVGFAPRVEANRHAGERQD